MAKKKVAKMKVVMKKASKKKVAKKKVTKNTIETNVIYCADNLDVMRNLPSSSIDLVYIDPPFFSNRDYESH